MFGFFVVCERRELVVPGQLVSTMFRRKRRLYEDSRWHPTALRRGSGDCIGILGGTALRRGLLRSGDVDVMGVEC